MTDKITSAEIHTARLVLEAMEDGQTEIPQRVKEDLVRWGNHDVAVIQHLVNRIVAEGTLAEEQHRYLAKGVYDEWVEPGNDSMPDEIFNEFPTHDGIVQITPDEFKDILAYVAKEYYG